MTADIAASRSAGSASASAVLSRSTASTSRSRAGERLGLIGPNGSGKSTLVNCLCGTLHNETGSVVFDGKPLDGLIAHERTRLGLARSFQLPKPFHTLNLIDNHPHPAALHGQRPARPPPDRRGDRRALPRTARHVGLADKAPPAAARPDPGRDAQARTGPRRRDPAAPAVRRRGDGRAVAFRGRGDPRGAVAAQRGRASRSS